MLNQFSANLLTLSELRQRASSFLDLFRHHLSTHWIAYFLVVLSFQLFSTNYLFGFNATVSLPQSVFLIHKGQPIAKGDYVAFTVPPAAARHFKNPKATLTKVVIGTEGDKLTVVDRVVHVNGIPVGFAKTHSLKREPLFPIEPVVIPFGYVYVMGLHKDSLDSRYDMVGLVPYTSIVGKALPIF